MADAPLSAEFPQFYQSHRVESDLREDSWRWIVSGVGPGEGGLGCGPLGTAQSGVRRAAGSTPMPDTALRLFSAVLGTSRPQPVLILPTASSDHRGLCALISLCLFSPGETQGRGSGQGSERPGTCHSQEPRVPWATADTGGAPWGQVPPCHKSPQPLPVPTCPPPHKYRASPPPPQSLWSPSASSPLSRWVVGSLFWS